MMKPNFFIIGAPKCGTTALAQYLSGHPNIFISDPKEPQYFGHELMKQHQPSLQEYLGFFEKADPAFHRAVGESTISYLFSQNAVPEILEFNPEARFIVILRNPVDLVYSWFSEMLYCGVENVGDFETAWRLEKERVEGKNLPPFCVEAYRLRYSQWGKLGDQMERLLSRVRREKLMVIVHDDFLGDTRRVYESVLDFLGAPQDGRKSFPKVNENKALVWPWAQRYLTFLSTGIWKIKNRLGIKKSSGILTRLIFRNRKFEKRDPLRFEFQKELTDFFRGDVQKLGKLIGRDLSSWLLPKK